LPRPHPHPGIIHSQHEAEETVLGQLVGSFRRSLMARNLSKHTVYAYTSTALHLISYLTAKGMPTDPSSITREHLEQYLVDRASTPTPSGTPPAVKTRQYWHINLAAFFRWLVDVDEIRESPMERIKQPRGETRPRRVITDAEVKAVLRVCEGKGYYARRDYALIMLFIDTGLRVSEMTALTLEDVDWDDQSITVRRGKGGKARVVYFGKRTARALDQYAHLRGGRREHRAAGRPELWLGRDGPLTRGGVYQMLQKRSEEAGVKGIHPHMWRHFFIHASLRAGAQVGDLLRQTGHARVDMLLKYGEAAADDRAKASHRRTGPGDLL
jgi:site-specific recombinase XerD